MRRSDRPKPYEPIIRGPLRLERRWSYGPPEAPVGTVEEEIVRALQAAARWNERECLKASRRAPDAE
jgi:hypothetical protein